MPLHGALEWIVQALDIRIGNASSFCADDGGLCIALSRNADATALSVAEAGPPLPAAMCD